MRIIFLCLISFSMMSSLFAQIYVATDGDDANPGTIVQPHMTITKAISVAVAGDTIYVRGGTFHLTSTITITATKSGTESQLFTLTAFNDEIPILDFSGQANGAKGISLRSNYWHIRGLQIKGAGDNGMEINFGSNNIIERCTFLENRDSGLQLSNGSANNRIINCDSYYNADPPDYADADGFAPKLTVGSGNYFYGCRAWGNVDDGWDGYLRGANDMTTTLENCWTWGNGYLKDGTDPGPQANGNGFKMGGGDNGNSAQLMHHAILINCMAFDNKNKGFDQNNNVGSMTLLNCTGYNNKEANYRIQRALNPGQTLMIKNCVSFGGLVQLGSFAVQEANSWQAPFVVTAEDFLSLDADLAFALRKAGGDLPDIEFMHLAQGSDLIDAGVDLGHPYNGPAPDLGAFESDFGTAVAEDHFLPAAFRLEQNYPNPYSARAAFGNPTTTVKYEVPKHTRVKITLYDILGQEVMKLVDEEKNAGQYALRLDAQALPSGIYFYRLDAGTFTQTRKMVLMR